MIVSTSGFPLAAPVWASTPAASDVVTPTPTATATPTVEATLAPTADTSATATPIATDALNDSAAQFTIPSPQTEEYSHTLYLPLVARNAGPVAAAVVEMTATPWLALPGDVVTYTLVVRNTGGVALSDGMLVDQVPAEVTILTVGGGTYYTPTRKLSWGLGRLEPGQQLTVTFLTQVVSGTGMTAVQNEAVFTARAASVAVPSQVTATATAALYVGGVATATITPQGGELNILDGLTGLQFPPGAVSETVNLTVRTLAELPTALPMDARYKDYGLDIQMRAQAGGESITTTLSPITITSHYADLPNLGNATSQSLLKFYHYDQASQSWEPLPTEVSPDTGVLTLTMSSFSPLALASSPQNNAGDYRQPWQPVVQDFQVDLFTGSATWHIPVNAPTGRDGLSPKLSLDYNSGAIDEMRSNSNPQAPWIGAGWSVGGLGYIEREIKPDANGVPQCKGTNFYLVLNGTSSKLISIGSGQYRTEDERFWRIEYKTDTPNQGRDYWVATTRDGTRYQFGYSDETTQVDRHDSAWWMVTPGCDGTVNLRQTNWRWNLDVVTTVHGNSMGLYYNFEPNDFVFVWGSDAYGYSQNSWCSVPGAYTCPIVLDGIPYNYKHMAGPYIRGGYLDHIVYSTPIPAASYRVQFNVAPRTDYPSVYDSASGHQYFQTFWSKKQLTSIAVKSAAGDLLRQYQLGYSGVSGLNALTSVQEIGSGNVSLPAVQFGYTGNWATYRDGNCAGGADGGWNSKAWLAWVDTGYGGTIDLNYTTPLKNSELNPDTTNQKQNGQTCDPVVNQSHHWLRYRVREVVTNPGVGNIMYTAYEYRNAANNYIDNGTWVDKDGGREFRGSPVVRVFQRRGDSAADHGPAVAYQDAWFHQGLGTTVNGLCGRNVTDSNGLQGRQYQTVNYDQSGNPLAKSVTAYQFTDLGNNRHFIAPGAECAYTKPGDDTYSTRTEYDYDTTNYGNMTAKREYARADGATPYRTTTTDYVPNSSLWIVGTPSRVRTFSGSATGAEVSQVKYYYDDRNTWNVAPTQGNVVKQEVIGSQTGRTVSVQNWYDSYGNITKTLDALGHQTTTTYDSTYHQFPIQTCNALSQCSSIEYYGVNGLAATTSGAYFGAVYRAWDANGQSTASLVSYDGLGRAKAVARPLDSLNVPSVSYEYAFVSPGVKVTTHQREISGQSGTLDSVQYYDGLGRSLQTRTEASTNPGNYTWVASSHTVYDALGRPVQQYVPFYATASAYMAPPAGTLFASTGYDALGRAVIITNTDGTVARTAYDGWRTAVQDTNNHYKAQQADAFGRLVRVEEYTGAVPSQSIYATTIYTYNVLNNLTDVRDVAGNVTHMGYDDLGRKVTMADPDMGNWSYQYDNAGNLLSQTDAKSQTITLNYDALNRLTSKSTGVTYGYDTGANGVGHRVAMTDTSGSASWTYDIRGRMTNEAKTIAGVNTFNTGYAYDPMDRVTDITYPTGEGVHQTYDNASRLLSAGTYASGMQYNAMGQIKQVTLGNGAVTKYAYYGNGDGAPAINSFRLWQVNTSKSGNLLNLQYGYDNVGNVTSIADTVMGQTQSFQYDALDRLLHGQATGGSNGTYSEDYTYTSIGNIQSKTGLGTYAYATGCSGGTSHALPHAVASTTGGNSYSYDCNGNMLTRNEGGVNNYTQQWDIENRLTTVSGNNQSTTFVYDGDGNRVLKLAADGSKTAYVNALMEITYPASSTGLAPRPSGSSVAAGGAIAANSTRGSITALVGGAARLSFTQGSRRITTTTTTPVTRLYYFAGSQRIAMRETTSSGDTVYYFAADHLGSTSLTMGPSGNTTMGYRPFGETRYGATPTDRRFTGQRSEEATLGSLYDYGARFYSPVLGRFISADTIVPGAGNPQAFNRYAYVGNNPLKYIDPSGHVACNGPQGECRGWSDKCYGDECNDTYPLNTYIPGLTQALAQQKSLFYQRCAQGGGSECNLLHEGENIVKGAGIVLGVLAAPVAAMYAAASPAVYGVLAYTAGNGVVNRLQQKDVLDGWNLVDVVLAATGSTIIAKLGLGALGTAVVSSGQSAVSQFIQTRHVDGGQMVLNFALGGIGAKILGTEGAEGAYGVLQALTTDTSTSVAGAIINDVPRIAGQAGQAINQVITNLARAIRGPYGFNPYDPLPR